MSNTVLKLQKVTKTFGGKGDVPLVEIFNGMDFSVKTNEVVGLFSPSGSGKTTFLQIAGLLDSKFYGDIYICLLYTSPSPRDTLLSRMPSSA